MNIYHQNDYKDVLAEKIKEFQGHRGTLAKLAEAAGCQRSYLSQVLNTHVQFTPDHALGVCSFFEFTEDETQYFLLLVDLARAGSTKLKQRIQNQLKQIRDRNTVLEKKISANIVHATEQNYLYYSNWIYSAVHIAVSIPELQTAKALSNHFFIPLEIIEKILADLESMKLISRQGQKWSYAAGEQHLSRRSALISLHHNNWRNKAVMSSQTHPEKNYHYTGISSLSRYDYQIVSDILLEVTEKIRKIISVSKEEELICLNMDFFKL